jgi:predicted lipid-binding transport protein (Tim44 family)
MFDESVDLIVLMILSVFVLFKLYTVLGKKEEEGAYGFDNQPTTNVVDLKPIKDEELEDEIEIRTPLDKKIQEAIQELRKTDPSITRRRFLLGAEKAFEAIIEAFSKGDKPMLKELLSKEVYDNFVEDIKIRNKEGQVLERTIVSIGSSEIVDVKLDKAKLFFTVKFLSKQMNTVKNKAGDIVKNKSLHVEAMEDAWTFCKKLKSKSPNWQLVETNVK